MAKSEQKYHVVRRDYYGDPGRNAATNVSREVAEKYVAEMQAAKEQAHFEIVESDGK